MKKVMLILMLGVFSMITNGLNAQSQIRDSQEISEGGACSCDSMFSSCKIKCGSGSSPKCHETQYFGCSCECKEDVLTYNYKININNVKVLHEYFNKISRKEISHDIALMLSELKNKSNNNLFLTNDLNIYNNYFKTLRHYFEIIPTKNQKTLYNKFES